MAVTRKLMMFSYTDTGSCEVLNYLHKMVKHLSIHIYCFSRAKTTITLHMYFPLLRSQQSMSRLLMSMTVLYTCKSVAMTMHVACV